MTDALETLRQDVRRWLAAHAPQGWREYCTSNEAFLDLQRRWFATLAGGGYAVPHWPAEWPGGGRSLAEQKVIYEEFARADTPRLLLSFMSTYHAASTLFEWGSAAQQQRYIPRILEGEIWCQGFSEPNAGSDLASLKTRAERQGDVYIVNGQKLWSTMGQFADKCLLLVRTSNEGAKQAGLTYLLLDLKARGVTARPIHQIHGDEEFAELFLDNVEIPVEDRLGAEGQGWAVAQSTLSSERGLTLLELSARMRGALWRIADLIRAGGRENDPGILRDFGRLATKIDATCAIADQFLANRIAGEERVGDASIVKLSYSRTLREFTLLGLRLGGMDAQYHEPITFGGGMETGNWMADFMNSYAWTIAGGSDEVQRNIIAERLLNMPREPKSWTLAGDAA
ncbi:acyl-CoA dehydrogenase family protein [Sphingobium boeckii]|uniref:Alkylation response protein AidB-like acyl-CoA dehydrogenase n=1 Tax=Sphingobium boeckii TaxID=1082345 RepID=A0A7W9AJB5_9SPHN|nr:acyl-CoA dehydrogenase family protein [Sphingobium boeckii]MBB5686710.1 alkylation response protein AidB-like acyl-CoA dehydrogenase [Sphingobium boeckii]